MLSFRNYARKNVRPGFYLIVGAFFLIVGTIASKADDPRVVAGAILGGTLALVVVGILVALLIHVLLESRRERIRYERQQAGLCVVCGYDLRAAMGETCPECGLPISKRK